MCGLAGFWDMGHTPSTEGLHDLVARMADALCHRGPDDQGSWVDDAASVAFGFRRLAIADLTSEGRQPMVSASGRYVLASNGEVYNFQESRAEIKADGSAAFHGLSDTDVMLAGFDRWRADRALERFAGMFAFAVWDRGECGDVKPATPFVDRVECSNLRELIGRLMYLDKITYLPEDILTKVDLL